MDSIEQATAAPGEKRQLPPHGHPVVITDGDKVVVEVPGDVSAEQIERIRAALCDELGCSVVVLVGARVSAVRRG